MEKQVINMPIYSVGDVVSNQKGHLRVILEIIPESKELVAMYAFMELESLTGGSYFMNFPKGKKGTSDFYTFEKYHYLYEIK